MVSANQKFSPVKVVHTAGHLEGNESDRPLMGSLAEFSDGDADVAREPQDHRPQIFIIAGPVMIVAFAVLLSLGLPSGPTVPLLAMTAGLGFFIGGIAAYRRRRKNNVPPAGGSTRTAHQELRPRWYLSNWWLVSLIAVGILVILLELPAILERQAYAIAGTIVASVTLLVSAGFLLRRNLVSRASNRHKK